LFIHWRVLVSANYMGISGEEIGHTEIREASNIENQPDIIKNGDDH